MWVKPLLKRQEIQSPRVPSAGSRSYLCQQHLLQRVLASLCPVLLENKQGYSPMKLVWTRLKKLITQSRQCIPVGQCFSILALTLGPGNPLLQITFTHQMLLAPPQWTKCSQRATVTAWETMRTGFSQECFLSWLNCGLRLLLITGETHWSQKLNSRSKNKFWNQKEQVAMRLGSGFQPAEPSIRKPCWEANKSQAVRSYGTQRCSPAVTALQTSRLNDLGWLPKDTWALSSRWSSLNACSSKAAETKVHWARTKYLPLINFMVERLCTNSNRAQILGVESTMSKRAFHYHPPLKVCDLTNQVNFEIQPTHRCQAQ